MNVESLRSPVKRLTTALSSTKLLLLLLGVFLLAGAFSVLAVAQDWRVAAGIALSACLLSGVLIPIVTVALGNQGPMRVVHPLAAPLLYLLYALLIPLVYMALTGNGIGSIPNTALSAPTLSVMLLMIAGFIGGAILAGARWSKRSGGSPFVPASSSRVKSERRVAGITANCGRLLLALSFLAKLFQLIATGPVTEGVYGADQLSYDAVTAISVIGEGLLAVACLLVMYGNTVQLNRALRWFDWCLLLGVLGISLVGLGSRGEVIAPIILFLWFRLWSGKRVQVRYIVGGVVAIATLFMVVWQFRAHVPGEKSYPILQSILWQTSSPALLTANVTHLVPHSIDFYWGSTYLDALKYMLPGPITRSIFGSVQGTGSMAYRDLMGYTNPNQGWGFAFPTEGYLNFGYVGVAISAVLLGVIFARAYLWATNPSRINRLSSYVYPLVLSYLPYGLRTDALGELKSIVYPLILIVLSLLLAHWMKNRRARNAHDDSDERPASLEGRRDG